MMPFFLALKIFVTSGLLIFEDQRLFRWYKNTFFRSVLLSLLVIALFGILGFWGILNWIHDPWASLGAVLLWVLVIFYVSSSMAVLFMSFFISVLGGEDELLKWIKLEHFSTNQIQSATTYKDNLKNQSYEFWVLLRNLGIAAIAWPLFLLPWTAPLAVLVYAYIFASESLAAAKRLLATLGNESALTFKVEKKLSLFSYLGLGLIPAFFSLFPFFGWLFIPILLLSALRLKAETLKTT